MTMLHDVLRFMVRSGPRTPLNVFRALAMIDGDEAGFKSVEEYEAAMTEKHGRPWHLPRTREEVEAETAATD